MRDLVRHGAEQEALGSGHALVADDDEVGVGLLGDVEYRVGRITLAGVDVRVDAGLLGLIGRLLERVVDVLAGVDHPLQVLGSLLGLLAQTRVGDRLVGADELDLGPDGLRQVDGLGDRAVGGLRAVSAHHDGSEHGSPSRVRRQRGAIIWQVIDLHFHVLPGIDDGPPTLEAALDLARAAEAAGTTTIVATPHVSWDWPDNDAARIAAAVASINEELRAAGIGVEVLPGAEVAMTRAADLPPEELEALRLGGGPYLLVECPHSPAASGFEGLLASLSHSGHRILLAHPERCPAFRRDRSTLERLLSGGMLTSITAGSLAGRFGREVRRFTQELLRDGMVHNIASDAHDLVRRPPGVKGILAEEGVADATEWFTRQLPEAILGGGPLPPAPVMSVPEPERDGLFGRLFRRA